jgi:tetratricopeptide (TPR) repeat protein
MGGTDTLALAARLFHEAFAAQMRGRLDEAVQLYRRSIDAFPTAEAHTFLGWTYSFQGLLDEAIGECRKAIAVDPAFGNPYNDIGAYLFELGRYDEAIPWLEKAKRAPRYEAPHYPRFNLGRVYVALEMYSRALAEFEEALALQPDFPAAQHAAAAIRRQLN